ncbi:hypothetical protein Scep_008041 [Stephania cephalantha]|uniref:K Homology domain-containing protein n=1 Tax=Stephania cephalantha TaxID=152367 RepID=A0AAP0KCX1_9MAGN
MIATRSLMIRVDRAWKFANTRSPRTIQLLDSFQGFLNTSIVDCNNKVKTKTMDCVWRRSCAASSSQHDVEAEAEKHFVDKGKSNKIGSHSAKVEVPASLLRFVKGKGGSVQKEIEEEIGVKLIFPSSKRENGIVIEGASAESVKEASNKIQVIIEEAVKSPNLDYSHFISLPLAIHPDLVDKLTDFQNSVLGNLGCGQSGNGGAPLKSDLGIDRSIFIKPKLFHLTVLMLKLWNNERVVKATEVLQRVSSKVVNALENRPVYVRLKGLECMRGSMAKARVLYTPVEVIGGEDLLLHACQIITEAYAEAGLVLEKDARQKLKLHGTVMNAKHRKRTDRRKISDSFDARGIVKQYGSKDWGKYLIREAHLSQRFVYDENGYYHCCTSIPFPKNS